MILLAFGTRPEWLKIKPLISEFKNHGLAHKTLFTGQHMDMELVNSNYIIDFYLNYKLQFINRLDEIIANTFTIPDEYLDDITHVLVQGDTASTFAIALYAFHRQLKIIYLESGLRTFNLQHPFPEEAYRQMITRIADYHICPTRQSAQNLYSENIINSIFISGNTSLDNLLNWKNRCFYGDHVLITLHRRENHSILSEWFESINNLAKLYPSIKFVFPLHPNPYIQKHKHLLTHVKILSPLQHDKLLEILSTAKLVITDSGGIQEEAVFFNKKVIVCRKTTERPEGIETGHIFLCLSPLNLKNLYDNLSADYEINVPCPYGDGLASKRIVKYLLNILV